jgi:hypothetical protein
LRPKFCVSERIVTFAREMRVCTSKKPLGAALAVLAL